MQPHFVRTTLAAALLASLATAQLTFVAPVGHDNTEGNSNNTFPWNRATSSMRIQFLYDSSNFADQGFAVPLVISRLRFRAENVAATTTWAGGTWPQVQIDMSTATVNHASASTTFASNHGTDLTTVLNGPVVVQPGAGNGVGVPGPWYIDIPLTTPFTYDPSTGNDLVVDIMLDGTGWTGTTSSSRPADHVTGTVARGTRVYNTTSHTATTGTLGANYVAVCEFSVVPVSGLLAHWTATPTRGGSPLTVQFTDDSYSNSASGVVVWQWDFNGDSVIDSTLQNPSSVFGCGSHNITLTVIDGVNPTSTVTRPGFIVTDEVAPSFTATLIGQPGLVQFTDTSVPTPTSWAWDLNGDSVTDSTVQNPVWPYGATCGARTNVRLQVNRNCGPQASVTKPVAAANTLETLRDGNTSTTSGYGGFIDVNVTNPVGIDVCMLEAKTTAAANAALTFDVYITPGTWVGKNSNLSLWRKVATANTTGAAAAADLEFMTFTPPFHLPAGSYGMHVVCSTVSPQYTSGTGSWSNADLAITSGGVGLLGATGLINGRMWNGALYYTSVTNGGDAGYGFFGAGCAGSNGVVSNTASALPKLGQTLTIALGNLAAPEAAVLALGFSRTTSIYGPLPLDLGVLGAPGCFALVSDEAKILVLGAAGTASLNLPIPNIGALFGMQVYTQPLGLDAAANALGLTAGDAAEAVVGN